MNELLNKRYITIKEPKKKYKLRENIKKSNYFNDVNFCKEIHDILSKYKQFIDNHYNDWDKFKNYTNLYELINYNYFTQYYKPLTLYEPISRAYFKLW